MLELVTVSGYKMYQYVPNPEPQLRAWVENPLSKYDSEPCYLLCEITAANKAAGIVQVREVNADYSYNVPLALVHCVHETDHAGRVVKVYGEPR